MITSKYFVEHVFKPASDIRSEVTNEITGQEPDNCKEIVLIRDREFETPFLTHLPGLGTEELLGHRN